LHCQQKELEHKERQRQHHDAYYVAAVVRKKACLRLTNEEINPAALSIVELRRH